MTVLLIGLFIGCMLGILINGGFQRFDRKLLLKILKKEVLHAYEEGIKFGNVEPKIKRINEISKEQIGYFSSLDRPNASAAHARHKNSIVSTIKKLEEEKMSIFKSILDSGSDPVLSIIIDGETKNVKVSELLPLLESQTSSNNIPTKTDPNLHSGATTLRLVSDNTKENKDDRPDPSNPTFH